MNFYYLKTCCKSVAHKLLFMGLFDIFMVTERVFFPHYLTNFCTFLCNRPVLNQELSTLFNELWTLDVNRMTPGIDYTISVQVRRSAMIRHTSLDCCCTKPYFNCA